MRSELRSRLIMYCWRFSRARTKPRRIAAGGTGLRSSAHQRSKTTKEKVMPQQCTHLNQIRNVTPSAQGCEDCLKTGDTWVHLRLCLSCGHVGCCDSSKNKHATKHYHKTSHPIIRSFETGENWRWCYPDQLLDRKSTRLNSSHEWI